MFLLTGHYTVLPPKNVLTVSKGLSEAQKKLRRVFQIFLFAEDTNVL